MNIPYTRKAVQILRRAQNLQAAGLIRQARGTAGGLDANGHGAACATQVLVEFLDDLRNAGGWDEATELLDTWLPDSISASDIVHLNDSQKLSFAQIADRITEAAGGPEALEAN